MASGAALANMSDMAALVANLHLVICVDAEAAHLDGEMGKHLLACSWQDGKVIPY
jgi:hypothetical protein